MYKLAVIIVALAVVGGCSAQRPPWVRTYPDNEAMASPLRYYDVEHLFAHRYFIAADFDLNDALSGSSGPSTKLDWSYNHVWHDQGDQITAILVFALREKKMAADDIEYVFQSFQITATQDVHREIEAIFRDLSRHPRFDSK